MIEVIGNAEVYDADTDSDDIIDNFDTLTYVNVNTTGKIFYGEIVKDLKECRSRPELNFYSYDYNSGYYDHSEKTKIERENQATDQLEDPEEPEESEESEEYDEESDVGPARSV